MSTTSNQVGGSIILLLQDRQPGPLSFAVIRQQLSLNKVALARALARLVAIEAVHVDEQHRLVTLLDAAVEIEEPAEVEAPAPGLSIEQERRLHDAILQRAARLAKARDLRGAVGLLNAAAERSRSEVATNFLVLADLYAAGHRRYPDITPTESEQLRRRSGYLTGADIDDALASER